MKLVVNYRLETPQDDNGFGGNDFKKLGLEINALCAIFDITCRADPFSYQNLMDEDCEGMAWRLTAYSNTLEVSQVGSLINLFAAQRGLILKEADLYLDDEPNN